MHSISLQEKLTSIVTHFDLWLDNAFRIDCELIAICKQTTKLLRTVWAHKNNVKSIKNDT